MPLILSLLLAALSADAAEVVWLSPPEDAQQSARALALAGADGPGTPLSEVPGLAAAFSEDDASALEALAGALRDVRAFEQRLDGELLIMRDLDPPLDAITVLRDDQDRARVYAARAYQGFAVDRFFEDTLGEDERAEPYRASLGGGVVPRPWLDAVALEPDRAITAYEIAEAPQRVRFEAVRAQSQSALPGALAVPTLPDGARLVVDGRPTDPGPGAIVRVRPGRHYAHVEVDDRIVARWSGLVTSGGRVELPLRVPDADAALAWVERLPAAPPDGLSDDLAALADEVWLVDGASGRAWEWTSSGIRPLDVSLDAPRASGGEAEDGLQPTVGLAVGAGWLATRDFYFQDPVNTEATFGTVNAFTGVVAVSGGLDLGALRIEGGVDLLWTPGSPHVARWADKQTHFRGFLHVAAGLPEARLAVGWLTPHHLGLGPRLALPLGPVELVGSGTFGIALPPAPEEGTWTGAPVFSAWAGVGTRFGSGGR